MSMMLRTACTSWHRLPAMAIMMITISIIVITNSVIIIIAIIIISLQISFTWLHIAHDTDNGFSSDAAGCCIKVAESSYVFFFLPLYKRCSWSPMSISAIAKKIHHVLLWLLVASSVTLFDTLRNKRQRLNTCNTESDSSDTCPAQITKSKILGKKGVWWDAYASGT